MTILPSSSSLSSRLASLLSFLSCRSISALIRFCSCCSSERQHAITAAAIHSGEVDHRLILSPIVIVQSAPPFPAKPRSQEASAGSACRATRDHHTGSVQRITQGLRLRSHTSCIRGSMSWWKSGGESLNKMEEEQRRVCAGGGLVVRRRSRPAST